MMILPWFNNLGNIMIGWTTSEAAFSCWDGWIFRVRYSAGGKRFVLHRRASSKVPSYKIHQSSTTNRSCDCQKYDCPRRPRLLRTLCGRKQLRLLRIAGSFVLLAELSSKSRDTGTTSFILALPVVQASVTTGTNHDRGLAVNASVTGGTFTEEVGVVTVVEAHTSVKTF